MLNLFTRLAIFLSNATFFGKIVTYPLWEKIDQVTMLDEMNASVAWIKNEPIIIVILSSSWWRSTSRICFDPGNSLNITVHKYALNTQI